MVTSSASVVSLSGQCPLFVPCPVLRRWPNIKPALGQYPLLSKYAISIGCFLAVFQTMPQRINTLYIIHTEPRVGRLMHTAPMSQYARGPHTRMKACMRMCNKLRNENVAHTAPPEKMSRWPNVFSIQGQLITRWWWSEIKLCQYMWICRLSSLHGATWTFFLLIHGPDSHRLSARVAVTPWVLPPGITTTQFRLYSHRKIFWLFVKTT